MQVWRLEPHLLEMLLPWVKKIGVTQFMSGMQCYPCHHLDELSDDRPVSGCAVGSRPPVSQLIIFFAPPYSCIIGTLSVA